MIRNIIFATFFNLEPLCGELRVQLEKVPLPDRKEGSLSCCGSSLFDLKAVIYDEIPIGHEDGGCLVISIDGVNQPFAHGIKWLL